MTKQELVHELEKAGSKIREQEDIISYLKEDESNGKFLYSQAKNLIEDATPILFSSMNDEEIINAVKRMLNDGWSVLHTTERELGFDSEDY